ncbi:maleylpyruvate isomerase family mycothiol-dependent enzyme, partial [Streptomyces sp. NPDC057616]|uniref:maleylpyruvate isomerase family mycothiol-dependent enzyme n=1 Tax=Streptomyces sp. NPDC057616 TaxID=3346183 RepID=UPI0036C0BE03
MTEHDGVRDLLAAWAFGALPPDEEAAVPGHLAACESCAAEAARLRETVRLLEGPAPNGAHAPPAADVLAAALRARPAAPRVAVHAAPYAAAVAGLKALLPEAEGRWSTPVVHDWDVHATVAHLLAADEPLAGRLGVAARPPARAAEDGNWVEAWNRRSAEVIAREHGRTPALTVAGWAAQAAALLAAPEAREPELAARATMLMGVRLPVADHYVVRAFETWIHTDDIGRALGLAVPPPPPAHLGQLVRLAVRVLGLALGPAAPPVLFAVDGGEQWVLGSEDEPVHAELALDPVEFCLLIGGRRTPEEVPRRAAGDAGAVRNVLERGGGPVVVWGKPPKINNERIRHTGRKPRHH